MQDYCKLEGLNKVFRIYMFLPLAGPKLESKKRMHVVNLDFAYDSQPTPECIIKNIEIQDLTPLDDSHWPLPPHVGFRVSGENIDHVGLDMKFTLVSVEVMARHC